MDDLIRELAMGKHILFLGFGREGRSSFEQFRKLLPGQVMTVADLRESVGDDPLLKNDSHVCLKLGPDYLKGLEAFDLIVRSPGVTLKDVSPAPDPGKITSQTDLFLRRFAPQVIGVTGTKGKSTTSSLICHMLQSAGRDSVLLGNIGTPAFHFLDRIGPQTLIVYELSSHQLEYITRSPHIGVLLNLFQEHLDAYRSFEDYQLAKMNIAIHAGPEDVLVYHSGDPLVNRHVERIVKGPVRVPFALDPPAEEVHFHNRYLTGDHNRLNVLAAMAVCRLCGMTEDEMADGIDSFKGLAHRMEYVGRFHGIDFYNDSIATIPEACMAAVRAIPNVDTLILGGFDRGIDYGPLAGFLQASGVTNLILVGMAGERIAEALDKPGGTDKRLIRIARFNDFLPHALKYTRPGYVCLLSPAAASYDEFRSFEERGMRFSMLVRGER